MLKQLKENKDIKFIYKIPCSLTTEYIIVGDVKTRREDEYRYFSMQDWFNRLQSGSLLPYVCSISSRTNKVKEYLNIYEKPDLLKFRKFILTSNIPEEEKNQECAWAIQIITEFRVNRICVKNDPNNVVKFLELIQPTHKHYCENESKNISAARSPG